MVKFVPVRALGWTVIVCFFLISGASRMTEYTVPHLWIAGVSVAATFRCIPRTQWWLYSTFVGAAVGAVTWWMSPGHHELAVGAGIAMAVGSQVVLSMMPWSPSLGVKMLSYGDLGRFLIAAFCGSAVATAIVVLAESMVAPVLVETVALPFLMMLSGLVSITPALMRLPDGDPVAEWPELVAQWLLVSGLLVLVFLAFPSFTILGIMAVPVIGWCSLRGTMRQTLTQIVIFTFFAIGFTGGHEGPFEVMRLNYGFSQEAMLAMCYFFIVALSLSALPSALAVALHRVETEAAQHERDRLGSLVDSANGMAIIGTDPDGTLNLFNRAAEELLGISAKEALGMPSSRFMSPEQVATLAQEFDVPPAFGQVARALGRSVHASKEVELLTYSGKPVTCSVTLAQIRDARGRTIGYVSTAEDASDRVARQQALAEALEAEQLAAAQLREIDHVKDIFVSSVSHELRTPITSMLGYLEVLEDGEFGKLNEDQMAALGRVTSNSNRLLTLIDDLLTLSRLEQQRQIELDAVELDLRDVVAAGVGVMSPIAASARVTIECEMPNSTVPFVGDPSMLERAVVNLVSNAVKFSRSDGLVLVSLSVMDESAVIRVRDNGLGIPSAEQGRLFTRFFRSSVARDEAIQGSGLGLSITHALATTYGGRIEFDSVEGVGTEFRLVLPLLPRQRVGGSLIFRPDVGSDSARD